MNVDPTFWVAISFVIFLGGLIYLKVPKKISNALDEKIKEIKNELNEAEKLKNESKKLLSEYESKVNGAKKEYQQIIKSAKEESEKITIENSEKFYKLIENRKKSTEQKISQIKKDAIKNIKNASVKISIQTVENLIKNSIDKNKLDKVFAENFDKAKIDLKNSTNLNTNQQK